MSLKCFSCEDRVTLVVAVFQWKDKKALYIYLNAHLPPYM